MKVGQKKNQENMFITNTNSFRKLPTENGHMPVKQQLGTKSFLYA